MFVTFLLSKRFLLSAFVIWTVFHVGMALADTAQPTTSASILGLIAVVLTQTSGVAGAYLTHLLQMMFQKIPVAAQPLVSAVGGIIITALGGMMSVAPVQSADATVVAGLVNGLIGHALVQTPPVPVPMPKA